MIVAVDGHKIELMDDGDRQVFHIKKGNGFEPQTLAAWAKLVQPGKIAVDVGAYTGLFSMVAAQHGAEVIAFEPMPANYWRFDVNIRHNKLHPHIRLIPQAVSDHCGFADLHYSRHTPLTTGGSIELGIEGHTDSIPVETVSIDSLALRIAAIKIDVERHELFVLKGALQTIGRDRPLMIIETLDDAMRSAILDVLPAYRVEAILDRRNTLFIPT